MARKNWPVGTVVQATCVITDHDGEAPRIVATPGEFGIVFAHCGSTETHEVTFPGGCFTSAPDDAAVRLYDGAVSTVCDGQPCHPTQRTAFKKLVAQTKR